MIFLSRGGSAPAWPPPDAHHNTAPAKLPEKGIGRLLSCFSNSSSRSDCQSQMDGPGLEPITLTATRVSTRMGGGGRRRASASKLADSGASDPCLQEEMQSCDHRVSAGACRPAQPGPRAPREPSWASVPASCLLARLSFSGLFSSNAKGGVR